MRPHLSHHVSRWWRAWGWVCPYFWVPCSDGGHLRHLPLFWFKLHTSASLIPLFSDTWHNLLSPICPLFYFASYAVGKIKWQVDKSSFCDGCNHNLRDDLWPMTQSLLLGRTTPDITLFIFVPTTLAWLWSYHPNKSPVHLLTIVKQVIVF